jgi:SlyX protein
MSDAIRHLEEKIAFLEHHVTEQDKVMLEFAEDIQRLKREMKLMSGRVAGSTPSGEDGLSAKDERPPHY